MQRSMTTGKSSRFGFPRRHLIDHAFLHPDRGGSDADGRFHHGRHQFRAPEDVDDIDMLGNILQARRRHFSPSTWDSFGFTGMMR